MLRKFLSVLLIVSILLVAVACAPAGVPAASDTAGESSTAPSGEVVTLDYYWIGNGDTDQRALVEAAINEYIEPLLGANVVFHVVGWGDWDTKAVTGLQAGEKMDIFFTADWRNYMQLVTQGLFYPLNEIGRASCRERV